MSINTSITSKNEKLEVKGMENWATRGQRKALSKLLADIIDKMETVASRKLVTNKQGLQRVLMNGGELSQAIISSAMKKIAELSEPYLQPIDSLEELVIDATSGSEGTKEDEMKNIFPGGYYPDFLTLDVFRSALGQCKAKPYKIIKGGNFRDFFGDFGNDLNAVCFSLSQVIVFAKKYADNSRVINNRCTLLPFKSKGGILIADVFLDSGKLRMDLGSLDSDRILSAAGREYKIIVCASDPRSNFLSKFMAIY